MRTARHGTTSATTTADPPQGDHPAAEDHLGLVKYVANRYQWKGVDFEDLMQEGVLGLLEAIARFDASRGVRFSTYAVWWIRQPMLLALGRQQRDTDHTVSLEAPLPATEREDEGLCLGDLLEAPEPFAQAQQVERQADLARLLSALSREECQVIACRYQLGEGQQQIYRIEDLPLSYAEVARQLGRTTEHLKKVEERALRKMRFWATRSFATSTS
jgi:RNA polymerase sigma factor (sigma-70 family)